MFVYAFGEFKFFSKKFFGRGVGEEGLGASLPSLGFSPLTEQPSPSAPLRKSGRRSYERHPTPPHESLTEILKVKGFRESKRLPRVGSFAVKLP
jgi:hypothetical protein